MFHVSEGLPLQAVERLQEVRLGKRLIGLGFIGPQRVRTL